MPYSKQSKGFTLVELIIAVTILGIFSAIAIPNFTSFVSNSRLQTTSNELASLLQYAPQHSSAKQRHLHHLYKQQHLDGKERHSMLINYRPTQL